MQARVDLEATRKPMPIVLDGKALARAMEAGLAERVRRIKERMHGKPPILAAILVGGDPASVTYVRMKGNACRRVGMDLRGILLPEETTTEELLATVEALNADAGVHGILLQYPVPRHIDLRRCFDRIAVEKDVDGVNCLSFGRMVMGETAFAPATPSGIMQLLRHYGISVEAKEAVVVTGRSSMLGKPMAIMLLAAGAMVTICHSKTRDLPAAVARADLVVGTVGEPEFIRAAWIRDGAVLIDTGYYPGGVGDIELSAAIDRSLAYTPVPGGIGPITIAMLIQQTIEAAEQQVSPGC